MWKISKVFRNLRISFRDLYNSINENECNTRQTIDRQIGIFKYTQNGNDNGKESDEKKGKSRKCKTCHLNPDSFTSVLAVGWASAVVVGLQYATLRWNTSERDELLRKKFCFGRQFLTNILCGSDPLQQRIFPEQSSSSSLSALHSSSLSSPSASSSPLSSPSSTDDTINTFDWDVDYSREQLNDEPRQFKATDEVCSDETVQSADELNLVALTNKCVAVIQNQVGIGMANQNRNESALPFFEAACELGNKKACFNAGVCYDTGIGTVKDREKAREFYQKAADLGHESAMYNLAVSYLNEDNVEDNMEKGLQWMQSAAEQGVVEAEKYMAIYYLEAEQKDKAFECLLSASKKNDVDSQYYLGLCYENGWGVQENLVQAVDLYHKAANKGNLDAMFNLAVCHELGLGGLPENADYALELYTKASDAGHQEAKEKIEKSHQRVEEFMKDSAVMLRNSFSSPNVGERYSDRCLSRSWSDNFASMKTLGTTFASCLISSAERNQDDFVDLSWNEEQSAVV